MVLSTVSYGAVDELNNSRYRYLTLCHVFNQFVADLDLLIPDPDQAF
jgi:hypothetical protein